MRYRNVTAVAVVLVFAGAVVFFGVVPREVARRNNPVAVPPPYMVTPAASALHASLDVAHASPALFDDVLAMATRPVVSSHTGVAGTCAGQRNLADAQLRAIAATGGVVGIGYWPTASCGGDVAAIIRSIRYTADLVGVEYVALGSDFDGSVQTPFDTTGLSLITAGLLADGFSEANIASIMGGNVVRLLQAALPAE